MSYKSTCESIGLCSHQSIAFVIGGNIGLCQLPQVPLGHLCLSEGLGEARHRHVFPLSLASEVLLQTHRALSAHHIGCVQRTMMTDC